MCNGFEKKKTTGFINRLWGNGDVVEPLALGSMYSTLNSPPPALRKCVKLKSRKYVSRLKEVDTLGETSINPFNYLWPSSI